jgi:hypothetical protein
MLRYCQQGLAIPIMPFVKGQSGNPSGKTRGFAGIARRIMDATGDGDELINFALSVLRDGTASLRERIQCLQWLGDRSLGRPNQSLAVTVARTEVPALPPSWRTMTSRERENWIDDVSRARLAGGQVIDILESGDSDDDSDDGDQP